MRPVVAVGVFVAGVGIGAGGCYLYLSAQRKEDRLQRMSEYKPAEIDAASVIRYHPALKFGVPVTHAMRFYDGFVADWDFRTRNPKWVFEHLTQDTISGDAERENGNFHEDHGVELRMRSRMNDFKGSGYDRGHMAAAANHKSSQASQDETFCLSNIAPQVGTGFNRDYWSRFERFCRDVTKRAKDVYVITGPLWLPKQHSVDGKWVMEFPLLGEPPTLLSVPTHFYKVILADNRQGASTGPVGVAAFVMPNAPIEEHKPLSAFVVPLSDLEAAAGVKFFPAFIDDAKQRALDKAAVEWADKGMQQLKPFERRTMLQGVAALGQTLPAGTGSSASGSKAIQVRPKETTALVLRSDVQHLCELATCALPRADFYKAKAAAAANNS